MLVNLTMGDTELIINMCKKYNLLRNQVAYVLATAYHESAHTMHPIREYGGEKYLKSKKYYPYVGMGYVQLTWGYNYKKAGAKLGVNFLSDPKLLLEPRYAAPILVIGMIEGWFTGKKLSDYITLQKSDFEGARKIINGKDKKVEIAKIAVIYDELLKKAGYGEDKPIEAPSVPLQPVPDDPGIVQPEERKTSVEHSPGYSDPIVPFIESLIKLLITLFGGKK